MADIRVERTSPAWVWWVIGLIALVLLALWALGAWNTDAAVYDGARHNIRGTGSFAQYFSTRT